MSDQSQREGWSPEKKEYFDKLDAVNAYIARSKFALVETFKRPLSKQYKAEIRHRVPENETQYDKVDELHKRSRTDYLTLRIATLLLLFTYLAGTITACVFFQPYIRARTIAYLGANAANEQLVSLCTTGAFLVLSAATAIGLGGIRWVFRWFYFQHVSHLVGDLAHHMSSTFDDIRRETGHACQQMDMRADPLFGHGWPERAQSWSRIALWSAIRGDALDKYSTVVLWKMKVSDANVEWGFRFGKGVLLIVCLFILFCLTPTEPILSERGRDPLILVNGVLGASVAWLLICRFVFKPNEPRKKARWYVELACMALFFSALVAFILRTFGAPPLQFVTEITVGFSFVMFFWWIWILGDERADDLWTDIFCKKIGKDTINTAFYFDSFSGRIRNLVELIDDKERNSRGTPAPAKD